MSPPSSMVGRLPRNARRRTPIALLAWTLLASACAEPTAPVASPSWVCPPSSVATPTGGCGPAAVLCAPDGGAARGACERGDAGGPFRALPDGGLTGAWREPEQPGGAPARGWRPDAGMGAPAGWNATRCAICAPTLPLAAPPRRSRRSAAGACLRRAERARTRPRPWTSRAPPSRSTCVPALRRAARTALRARPFATITACARRGARRRLGARRGGALPRTDRGPRPLPPPAGRVLGADGDRDARRALTLDGARVGRGGAARPRRPHPARRSRRPRRGRRRVAPSRARTPCRRPWPRACTSAARDARGDRGRPRERPPHVRHGTVGVRPSLRHGRDGHAPRGRGRSGDRRRAGRRARGDPRRGRADRRRRHPCADGHGRPLLFRPAGAERRDGGPPRGGGSRPSWARRRGAGGGLGPHVGRSARHRRAHGVVHQPRRGDGRAAGRAARQRGLRPRDRPGLDRRWRTPR